MPSLKKRTWRPIAQVGAAVEGVAAVMAMSTNMITPTMKPTPRMKADAVEAAVRIRKGTAVVVKAGAADRGMAMSRIMRKSLAAAVAVAGRIRARTPLPARCARMR